MTDDELKALRLGQPVLDAYKQIWTVACLWPLVAVSRGDRDYRTIGPGSPFQVRRSAE